MQKKLRRDEDFNWQEQIGARPLRLRPRNPRAAIWAGYLVSQLVGFGALALVTLVFSHFNPYKLGDLAQWTAGILGFSQFLLVPFGMGVVASYFWQHEVYPELLHQPNFRSDRRYPPRVLSGSAFLNTLLSCGGAFFILREGAICLLMASPVLWAFMLLGVKIGNNFWRKNPFLGVSLMPVFLLLIFAEAGRPNPQLLEVSTELHSGAAPAALWQFTANYPRNPHPPEWWLYKIGMPMPMQSTGAAKLGGRRDCLLSGGVDIGEKIVVAQKNRRLEFVIDRQPQHPEITHHMILERGRIDLIPDGQGGTILRGTSWYRLNVAPAAYFDLWSAAVVHHTHTRVFAWMDELARQ